MGQRITQSPARQATKLFTLSTEITKHLQFYPNRPTIADHLQSLKSHRHSMTNQLSECTLLMQSDLAKPALERLKEMRKQPVNTNELAHIEALITMCIDELYGSSGNERQIHSLESLLEVPDLNRINRARIIICLAQFYTFKEDYNIAKSYFTQLRSLVTPEDNIEYCWYHLYYGLFLRKVRQLDQAIYHQRLAHDSAQVGQWWHGVYAARYNLALIFISLADKSSRPANQKYLQDALKWANKAHDIALLSRKLTNKAEVSLLIAQIHRKRKTWLEARQWLDICLETNFPQQSKYDAHMSTVYQEIALMEEAFNNYFSATIARQKALQHRQKADSIEKKLSLISLA